MRESLNTSVKSGSKTAYAGGYYIAKQFSSRADEHGSLPTDSFVPNPDGVEILDRLVSVTSAFEGSSVALSGTDRNVLDASRLTRDVALLGSTTNDSLKAGAGDDQLYGGDGSDTLLGGNGQRITVIDRDGNETTKICREPVTENNVKDFEDVTLKGKTKLLVDDPFSGVIDAANFSSKLKMIDASGTSGNDKLYGGDGADVFVYDGQGKDKVYNYGAEDQIVLKAKLTGGKLRGKKVVLTFADKQTLTIDKASGVELTITNADGATNTYLFDKQHKTLEAALVDGSDHLASDAYWFMEDDSTPASELNEIVSTDAAVALDYDQMSSMIGSPGNELTYAPRHRLKK
ncbi:MAG: hypothetical protein IJ668_09930 [Selenomonadaceae bacterium]|nr:hypothetical protein [Selenomonadaceae bacterium]